MDYNAMESFAQKNQAEDKISFILNCAAYTVVDKAEDDEEKAARINSEGPRNIARLAKKTRCCDDSHFHRLCF